VEGGDRNSESIFSLWVAASLRPVPFAMWVVGKVENEKVRWLEYWAFLGHFLVRKYSHMDLAKLGSSDSFWHTERHD